MAYKQKMGGTVVAIVVTFVVVLGMAGCSGDNKKKSTPVTPTPPADIKGKIAFVSDSGGGLNRELEIYVMEADGSSLTRLTNNDAEDRGPDWSPDGTRIAFSSDREGDDDEIYVMNADGSAVTRLTNSPGIDLFPDWSPDGTKIAFVSGRDGDKWEIFVMNADGTGVTQLTHVQMNANMPVWSPDGAKIAFNTIHWDEKTNNMIADAYVINADDTGLTQLVANAGSLAWSPDGAKIAFSAFHENFSGEAIAVMNVDGTDAKRLIENGSFPVWSPDGSQIVFISKRAGNWEICMANADGSNVRQLTNDSHWKLDPDWQHKPVS